MPVVASGAHVVEAAFVPVEEVGGGGGCVGDSGEHLSVGFKNDDEADALEMFARSKSSRVVRFGSGQSAMLTVRAARWVLPSVVGR